MKAIAPLVVSLASALLPGCNQAPAPATLEPVAPPVTERRESRDQGGLIVFSDYDRVPFFSSADDPRIEYHSDFTLLGEHGEWVATVRNRSGALGDPPATTPLPPGRYRVVARATGLGRVEVPVVVAPGRITAVHLAGDEVPRETADHAAYDLVRLPDGRIAGWSSLTGGNSLRGGSDVHRLAGDR